MPTTFQFRRYDTANIANTTGAVGEIFIDTDKDTVVVQDGSTAGGFPLAREGAYIQANTARNTANDAYAQANTARDTANDSYAQANTARNTANDAYGAANTGNTNALNAYAQANAAYADSNTRVLKSGDTMTGTLNVQSHISANVFRSTNTTLAAPSLSTFDGERLRLYDFNTLGHPNYAIGVEGSHIWMGVDDIGPTLGFKWYGNTTLVGLLRTNSTFEVSNTVQGKVLKATGTGTAVDASQGNILTNKVTGTEFAFLNGLYTVNVRGAVTQTTDYEFRLPANGGTDGFVLATDGSGNTSWSNSIYVLANTARDQANTARDTANAAYGQANAAYADANTRVLKAGDTMTGNLNVAATLITQNVIPNLNVTYDLGTSTQRFKDIWLSNSTIRLGDANLTSVGDEVRIPKLNVEILSSASGINVSQQSGDAYNQANTARNTANDAYAGANTANTNALNAYGQANAGYAQANTARDQANTARNTANDAYGGANTANTNALNAYGQANSALTVSQNAYGQANTARDQANTARTTANDAYGVANTAQTTAQNSYGQANTARDQANTARDTANGAYSQANGAYAQANGAYGQANGAYAQANGSYAQANAAANTVAVFANNTVVLAQANVNFNNSATVNVSVTSNVTTGRANIEFSINSESSGITSAYNQANSARDQANTARDTANGAYAQANGAYGQANGAYAQANGAYAHANIVYGQANAAYGQANTARGTANDAYGQANSARDQANTARTQANSAYAEANLKLNLTGGTLSGDLTVAGNLTVTGSNTLINVSNLSVNDSIILMANGQVGDVYDMGFVGHFDRGATNTHAGFIRKASLNEFYLFDNYEVEPTNNIIDINGSNFRLGNVRVNTINANSVLILGSAAATQANLTLAHNQANTARDQANSARDQANTARTTANDAYGAANTAQTNALNAYGQANNARDQANTARDQANTARDTANGAYAQANGAYAQANGAYGQANGAYSQANTAANTVAVYANDAVVLTKANVNFNNSATVNVSVTSNTSTGRANIEFTVNTTSSGILAANTNAVNAYGQANAARDQANTARTTANDAYSQANTARTTANDAYGAANTAQTNALNAYGQANNARDQANTARDQANTARTQANTAYDQANSAYGAANNRVLKAGDTMTGNLTLSGATLNTSIANISTIVTGNSLTLSTGVGSNGNIILSSNGTEDLRITNTGFIGIFTTTPNSNLSITGNVWITTGLNVATVNVTTTNVATLNFQSNSSISTNSVATVTQDVAVTVDAFATASFRSAVYQAQLTRTSPASDYETITLSVVHDGTTVYLSQYGQNKTNASANMGTFDASIATGTLSLTFKPNVAVVTVKTHRNAITV